MSTLQNRSVSSLQWVKLKFTEHKRKRSSMPLLQLVKVKVRFGDFLEVIWCEVGIDLVKVKVKFVSWRILRTTDGWSKKMAEMGGEKLEICGALAGFARSGDCVKGENLEGPEFAGRFTYWVACQTTRTGGPYVYIWRRHRCISLPIYLSIWFLTHFRFRWSRSGSKSRTERFLALGRIFFTDDGLGVLRSKTSRCLYIYKSFFPSLWVSEWVSGKGRGGEWR